jgi:hypothetical protein
MSTDDHMAVVLTTGRGACGLTMCEPQDRRRDGGTEPSAR